MAKRADWLIEHGGDTVIVTVTRGTMSEPALVELGTSLLAAARDLRRRRKSRQEQAQR